MAALTQRVLVVDVIPGGDEPIRPRIDEMSRFVVGWKTLPVWLLFLLSTATIPAIGQVEVQPRLGVREDATGVGERAAAAPEPVRTAFIAPVPEEAARERGRHILVSLQERRLRLLDGSTVLYEAPVGVGKSVVLEYEDEVWDFRTPQGKRRVVRKQENPVWVPPDWHYVEVALANRWQVVWVKPSQKYPLPAGGAVTTRGDRLGRIDAQGRFEAVPLGDELVIEGVLYVPPVTSANRRISGQLGRYKIDLGEGYYLHGTQNPETVGRATTHGCIRLTEGDLAYLYDKVGLGTPVYIY
jgi:hypothetical protein